jgi:ABC-type transport system involved in cytochrome c biogenesis permease subunit
VTTFCIVSLVAALAFYLAAALLFQGHFLWHKSGWDALGRKSLKLGLVVHAISIVLHFALSGQALFANMMVIIASLVMALVVAGLLGERYARIRHLGLLTAPLAFLGLLYPLLMPVQFDEAESMLLRFPWLGVHVLVTLLGDAGFALAFCTAAIYLIQSRQLKRGRLNRYLPALDTAGRITDYAVGYGFFLFSAGLAMGLVWLLGAPGEFLGRGDPKILMAVPTWLAYAAYLYLRGVRGEYGSRLKWLVIAGFLFVVANLLGVRHDFAVNATL